MMGHRNALRLFCMVATQMYVKLYQALPEIIAFYVVYCMYATHQIKKSSSGFLFHQSMETLPTPMRR